MHEDNPVPVSQSVDFQDPGRYELELKAPVTGDIAGWSLQIDDAKVFSVEGLSPCWATDRGELFNPS